MLVQRVDSVAFGPLVLEEPFDLNGRVTCVTGPPASGRSSLLRALSLLGSSDADSALDYPRHLYWAARSSGSWLPAIRAFIDDGSGVPIDAVRLFGVSGESSNGVKIVVNELPDPFDPYQLLPIGKLVDSEVSSEESRVVCECLAAVLAEDLSRFSSRPVGVSLDDGDGTSIGIRIHDPSGPYSVPLERAGGGVRELLSLLAFASSIESIDPSLVLIDDLGSGLHPDLGPGFLTSSITVSVCVTKSCTQRSMTRSSRRTVRAWSSLRGDPVCPVFAE